MANDKANLSSPAGDRDNGSSKSNLNRSLRAHLAGGRHDQGMNEQSPLLSSRNSGDEESYIRHGRGSSLVEQEDESFRQKTKSSWYLIALTISIGGLQIAWATEMSNGSVSVLLLTATILALANIISAIPSFLGDIKGCSCVCVDSWPIDRCSGTTVHRNCKRQFPTRVGQKKTIYARWSCCYDSIVDGACMDKRNSRWSTGTFWCESSIRRR